jgi:hypothetical protein
MAKRVGLGPEEQGEDECRVEEGEADYPDLVRRAWVQPLTWFLSKFSGLRFSSCKVWPLGWDTRDSSARFLVLAEIDSAPINSCTDKILSLWQ